ncbi:MAG: DUF262 domain-containing protein [Candidatus Moraniibacteriota bacterium]
MSKLNVDQKTIFDLLADKKSDFLIPDYQRPYAWDEEQCQTLWDDIFTFSFPNDNYEEFDENEEYFLGSIVTFKNDYGKLEVIDGQQRLTTLMLILRTFYDKFTHMNDQNSKLTREKIEKCIWKTDTFGTADKSSLKIDSEVATDNDKGEFLELLRTGIIPERSRSQYINNFKFFQTKIDEFLNNFPAFFAYLPARILGNCILLPIEAESQDTALRIFSTLNNRGLPLSDADIFKAQFYKHYSDAGQKEWFIQEWRGLEDVTSKIFNPSSGSPMDELFTRYMYYLRAKEGNKKTTTESLRKFFERGKYKYLKDDSIIGNLKSLALFWENVARQNKDVFSEIILKKLFVLNYAPNGMWQYITSVYFLRNKNENGMIDSDKFLIFLDKITAFIFAYAITNPGVNALRTPIYAEMIKIINGSDVSFSESKFSGAQARNFFENYKFTNLRPITRSLITWYAYTFENQELLDINETFELEHIFSKKRQEMEQGLTNEASLESLGNKILLEEKINIRASDYRFEDKKKIYSGEMRRGRNRDSSKNTEIIEEIIKRNNFDERDIIQRSKTILNRFFELLEKEKLIG